MKIDNSVENFDNNDTIGENHIATSHDTPLRPDAFSISDKEKIESIKKIIHIKREVRYGKNSRIDFLVNNKDEEIYIEVKNVTLSLKKGI